MEKKNKKSAMIAASLAGILALAGAATLAHADDAAAMGGDGVACYGVNACKGKGVCGAKGHSCAGENSCKGHGFLKVESKDACLKMEGGSLTALPVTD